MMKKEYKVEGMSCVSCASGIERTLKLQKGVNNATVNYANESLTIEFDEKILSEENIQSIVKETGYEIIKNTEKITMIVEGMSCSSCSSSVETTVKGLKGVINASVNLVTNRLYLEYDSETIKLSQVQKAISDIGYSASIGNSDKEETSVEEKKATEAKKKMFTSAVLSALMMFLMLINMFVTEIPGYIYIAAILGFPVVFIFGFSVHKKSISSLKAKRPNMDVLVSLGSIPPYTIGLLGLFFPIVTFIEMATMIMTLHLVGKYLESRAKGKASQAIRKLMEIGSKTAKIIFDGNEIEVMTNELTIGDLMIVRPGEKIPMDGVVIEGESLIDESIATGESLPVSRKQNDPVIGGTINKNGVLKVEVTKVGDDTFLAQIIKMVEACQGSKVPIQEFADRITGYFVPGIIVLTLLTFASFNLFPNFHISILSFFENILPWINTGQSPLTLAFVTATAVLVIACPCALGLGTPTALMVGSGKGAENGVLIRNGEAVQTFKDIKAIAFDKTGTLTLGKPVVTDIVTSDEKGLMAIAYALEQFSEHPLAMAIIEKAKTMRVELVSVNDFTVDAGYGVKGTINQKEYFAGNPKYMDKNKISFSSWLKDIERLETEAKTVVLIANQSEVLGLLSISDSLKPEVKKTIAQIEKMGIKTVMITGDNQKTAEAIAFQAGISKVIASVLPDGKVQEIERLQSEYGLVAMVGDGINDAPALKQANVGIAIGTGTDIAIESSDITIISPDLNTIIKALTLSKAIFKKIKENYFWAWFYNALAIPFAMLGLLHPMIGALAMSLSSLNVIYNSLRLKKINLNQVFGGIS